MPANERLHPLTETVTVRAPAGRYAVVPFGDWYAGGSAYHFSAWSITGAELAEPHVIELHTNGGATPAELTLRPLPPPKNKD